jgi:excisionase family DNA binding protein
MSNGPSPEARAILARETPFTTGEVAKLFNVDPKTVARWAAAGRIESFKTLGGHRRYEVDKVVELMTRYGLRYTGRPESED